ncbi:hypothetical protein AB0442_15850 [Kitasatospora sp. NPDC085895]|uniref:hypothetical protein n=1 Tax=Kitasatospora sp. NPDC085895 TaxID=3155057 RepID=UPI003450C743
MPDDGATRVDLTAARIEVPAAGGRYAWTTVRADLAVPAKGVHELRIVLRGALRLAEAAFG